ncbi:MAG: hypothetical protein HYR96_10145 [Deltaproteobacteria bacterium]|nr:hypothetical protein [Deltaproteobacteria bacterium]MBI3295395.1 hypothetical protein [Deltaproteobacteria bacterium]
MKRKKPNMIILQNLFQSGDSLAKANITELHRESSRNLSRERKYTTDLS